MQHSVELKLKDYTLRGTIHIPDDKKEKHSFVVIYHGFLGSKIGPGFMFVKLSRELEKLGIGSLRFDFSGSGESDGSFESMTVSKEVFEAKEIFKFLSTLEYIDTKNLFMVGLSMGGLVTSLVAPEFDKLNSMVLWAPAGNMNELAKKYSETSSFNGVADIEGLILNKGFIDDIERLNVWDKIREYKKEALIIHGNADEVIDIKIGYKYKEIYGDKSKFIEIEGADHVFQRADWKQRVIGETVNFINSKIR